MLLDKLIADGEQVKNVALSKGNGKWLSGEEYETWIATCTLFMENQYPNSILKDKFSDAAKNAVGNGTEYYDRMIGILKGIRDYGDS